MPLLLPTELQFATEYAFSIPDDAFREFQALIRKINPNERCTEKHILETFKKHMSKPAEMEYGKSSCFSVYS